ncbi:Trans-aconitate 2-methyltransferase [Paraburkholderia domus]|jgi:Methylase involved in ubiquinone/menaquinone biosynthesis|uniref:methyltransferase domain-containing protein n=1 Tax=Paraburkholderia domus TaxID=2793075 RepID=UPI0019147391|nr:methyltransferase domain-containing protein [Paraburkholderia domus]MBK5048016.1 methyltransferase domain-containing protein [Burkholderia sp. R-70006]MBK5063172.1 methyltransferase domain-containing protein [Burkholderia sp. R-70199]MBK5084481.1 methyltransferase domain-containing protein [Burkholderia sp. R-69927]CAE6695042.1 Trans-aconitate 2-methyltransferase [Paraburkholderia domus]CAE6818897.1 Trans-aconitate 2-methyltransferase [Paraburkholderia domus]
MPPTSSQSGRPAYDSRRLRQIFDRRAATFDNVAFLPREIAQRMRERLDYIKVAPASVLDAGCGAGEDIPALRERFPEAPVFGTDLSHGMLARALRHDSGDTSWRRFLPATLGKALGARGPRFAQADFSALPFAAGAFEFIWSNLALHWHSRPDLVFPEWQRVLKVNGLLMFSTLGPDSLKELRGAYAEVEAAHGVASRKHVIDFVDMHDLGDMLVESGFEIPVMDQETLTITYKSPESLLTDVRRWGAYPFEREATSNAVARRLHKALLAALEARARADGTIALTFEVIYGHAWKAVPRTTAEGHGIVRIEDIGRGSSRSR